MQVARCRSHAQQRACGAVADWTAWRQPQRQHAVGQSSSSFSSSSSSSGRRRAVSVAAGKGFGSATKKGGIGGLLQKKDLWGGRQPVTPHQVSPMRPVPPHIRRPPYADNGRLPDLARQPQVHGPEGVARMRAACALAARVLAHAGSLVRAGVTTDELDAAVHEMVVAAGAYPSPLNYGRFPKSVCTSVNEVMCHGIPDARPLRDGDLVNVDVTVFLDGYHGDTSRSFFVGAPTPAARRLVEANEEALAAAIEVCGPGVPLRAIGEACAAVAAKHKLTVVRDFIGHGVGTVFHAAPQVFHHRNSEPGTMQLNSTFTIEPIFSEGSNRVHMWKDGWTATTVDGGLTAQCEHTILITPDGCEVLTVA